MTYAPQVDDLSHALNDVAGFGRAVDDGLFPGLSRDLVAAILDSAGAFAADVIAPLNRDGDLHGCTFDPATHEVTTAPGWRDAYRQWCEGGWSALPGSPDYGGQGLPLSLALAAQELWNSAASAYGVGTLLTQGAVDALTTHGSDALKSAYLPKMIAGEWTGTMNLTEPQAGSDLGALQTRAEPASDGSYRIFGTKIFITYGEHDLTDNIVHLVLARLPDAPPGTRGISLFLVPRQMPDGSRNDVTCIGLEHKLGIHGSPTCMMRYGEKDGAVGWLVGEENRGLACMFTMMNAARLNVGMQGVAIAERATQQALAYARERRQGRRDGSVGMVPIIEHADVRRMLLDMKSQTAAARAVCFLTAMATDLSHHLTDAAARARQADRAALLTPIAKAYGTDVAVDVASIGVQVHGGMGYIEETGAAQHFRDARITPIYEGTNGIQAIDLVARKLPLAGGEAARSLMAEIAEEARALEASGDERLKHLGERLAQANAALADATETLGRWLSKNDERALAVATPYLRLAGLTVGALGLARGAAAVVGHGKANDDLRLRLALYFADNHLPFTSALRDIVKGGGGVLVSTTPDMLAV